MNEKRLVMDDVGSELTQKQLAATKEQAKERIDRAQSFVLVVMGEKEAVAVSAIKSSELVLLMFGVHKWEAGMFRNHSEEIQRGALEMLTKKMQEGDGS